MNGYRCIANSLFFTTLGKPKQKLLKWLKKIVTSMDPEPQTKIQLYSSTNSWDEANLIFDITLGMPRRPWPHPIKISE